MYTALIEEQAQKALEVLDATEASLTAMVNQQAKQVERWNRVLSQDDRELLETYIVAYPNATLTDAEQATRDGAGRAGEAATASFLDLIPHSV